MPTTKQLKKRSEKRLKRLRRANAPAAVIQREQKHLDNLTGKERDAQVIQIKKK